MFVISYCPICGKHVTHRWGYDFNNGVYIIKCEDHGAMVISYTSVPEYDWQAIIEKRRKTAKDFIGCMPRPEIDFNYLEKLEQQGLNLSSEFVEINPKKMGGNPIFKGTRITLDMVLAYIRDGYTIEKFLEDYPHITKEMVDDIFINHNEK